MKKFISLVTSLTVAASAIAPALTSAASDFLVYADYLAGKSVIKKTDEAGYRLGDKITRAEMAKVAANLAHLELKAVDGKVFGDVTDKLGDLAQYIEAMASAGYVAKNANFRPMDLVTRAEMVKMLLKAKGVQPSDEDQGFADIANIGDLASYVNAAAKAGIISKNANFRPNDTASRGEVFKVAAKADGFVEEDDLGLGDLFGTGTTSTGTTSTGVVTPTAAGDLSVSLNPASLPSGTLIPQSGIIRFAVVDFKAGGSDISLNTVELKKAGLSTVSSSVKVWFEKNGARLSGKASFTSEGNVVVSFAPAFVVKAGTTETMDLYVELPSTTSVGTDYTFTSGQITSSAKNLAGAFTTPTLRTADYKVATFVGRGINTPSNYKASNDLVELGAFAIDATKPAGVGETRDEKFQSVTLYQSGSADLVNLANIVLVRDGKVVSTSAKVDGKALTLTLNDLIKDGTTATYYVKANIINVENQSDSYQFYIKNTSDFNIVEAASGFRATTADASKFVSGLYTVNGGDVKFERDTSVALSANVAPGTAQVVLMQGMITAKNAIKLEDPTLKIGTATNTGIANLFNTLYLQIGSSTFSATATGVAGDDLTFNGTVTISGTANVKLYGTLKSNIAGSAKVAFDELRLANFSNPEYVANQNKLDTAVGSISGVTVTIDTTTLNATRNDSLGNTNLASGSKGVTLYGIQLTSTKGNPINVTSATFAFSGSNSSTSTGHLNNVFATLYVDGNAVSSKTVDAATVKFDNFTATVSSTKSANMVIKADFSDSFAGGNLRVTLSDVAATDTVSSKAVTVSSLPAGALFTMATADATLALSDSNPQASLFLSPSQANKLFAFKVTAKNDAVKVKDLSLTGTALNLFSNYRLTDAAGNVLATSATATDTSVTFESAQGDAIAMDKSATYFVVADANSNTSNGGTTLTLTSVTLTGTNGKDVVKGSLALSSKTHAVAENTAVIAKASNPSKDLLSSALRFTVAASGKDQVTLTGALINLSLNGYSGGTIYIYKDSVGTANIAGSAAITGTTFTNTINLDNGNGKNTVDAGSSATFIVTVEGSTLVDVNSKDWSVRLQDVNFGNINAASYNNIGQFPITEVK